METDEELEKLRNEVLRKIGRNVILFQQMEQLLKFLLANGSFSSTVSNISDLKTKLEKRITTVQKQTMGQVANQFLENTFSEDEEDTQEELKETLFSFRYRIQCDEAQFEERKIALTSLVAERNDLIHHLLPKWQMQSYESSIEIEQYLDQQREKILPELEWLKANFDFFKEYLSFMASDEGQKEVDLSILRQTPIVTLLFNIGEQNARPDGWVVLKNAEEIIQQHLPEGLSNLEKLYGYKKLDEIILATEFFDLAEEVTTKGDIRLLYRIKPDLHFTD
jgi:hypothetical protein